MTHTPHELAEESPGRAARIHALKEADAHFARLVADYHEVNRAVHRAETDVEPVGDAQATRWRRRRMELKDAIARRLAAAG